VKRFLSDESGITIIELVVVVMISALGAMVLFVVMDTTSRTEIRTDQDSRALASMRLATQRLTKELRQSGKLYSTSNGSKIRFWVDYDRDGNQDDVEQITWQVTQIGGINYLTRHTHSNPTPVPWVTDITGTIFTYNRPYWTSTPPPALPLPTPKNLVHTATLVTITLTGDVAAGSAPARQVQTQVRLRNAPN
jgi:type II secretory pathway pseudopilin PulG